MTVGTDEQIAQWKKEKIVGIIGLGDMGQLYAEKFSEAGWNVVACDREELYDSLKEKYANAKFTLVQDGHRVSRVSDFIIYSVEAANIDKIVGLYGPSSKINAIVGGQTSCKRPEVLAFERLLPSDTKIITVHSLHGPKVNTEGQPLVIIDHRSNDNGYSLSLVDSIMSCLKSEHVYLTCDEHDKITADTQAVTHAAFLSMGSAWAKSETYPWDAKDNKWQGGIENVKINISLRIYSNKWHVYAGLAITNPQAHKQILQYATSVTELFTLFIDHKKEELTERIMKAKEFVFGNHTGLLLLDDSLLDEFSLSEKGRNSINSVPNSHLSLLAIVDSWYQLGINPYDHMICSTPLFRIFLGVSEYLFLTPGLLDKTIDAAIDDKAFRSIDLEFVVAARKWSSIVSFESFDLYQKQFDDVQKFFEPMFPAATKIGNDMIKKILAHSKK
ncbi:similar to Saccharomyces cerevisiae YBR166C TYR1 Prephenate dehydrogenase involved in tyrosine biosynthesis, expression is dependent on phenylalanine levels [Maudiozyma barnettii]|uniref:Prephenate dehydrogenase [NADP(+)] n=1 Tax=Maudiozyma barnettii TaxID=61262 RepID=A0A8H2VDS6_9SACH|nr:prephenate dehydrogenase (NADP(+)) [Kazachstania barnettii]CAB4253656.1 similar to Saccharomyces cerevisiae YBR166C TYR1 Prephenate dehydrogenase involved in tyrosine biosynthesis, expression is dependent on phenylalanine levels [Kazachstania barnettii]CAD1781346.1 similar to Saccharomyces cerevisiae YBR166C TYR1 Prephenate dehydrogenase involved in tyrosine biosynthesis, expression is dependent on phenylalanine levels [Kazachstania barnettii]